MAEHGRAKGIYRYFYYRNSLLLRRARETIERLCHEGIKVALFKGAAIALKYHRNPGLRPMADVDILIPEQSFSDAARIVEASGWQHVYSETLRCAPRHSDDFKHPEGHGFDLHRHALVESADPEFNAGLLERARPFDWDGLRVHVMAPEDLILTSLCNGVREPEAMRLEWIPDVLTICRTEKIDWVALWQLARRFDLQEPVFDALCLAQAALECDELGHAIDEILGFDQDFLLGQLRKTIAEGRADILQPDALAAVAHRLAQPNPPRTRHGMFATLRRIGRESGHARYIRFDADDAGQVNFLWLQSAHLPRVAEVFTTNRRWLLQLALLPARARFAGTVRLSPGTLELPRLGRLPEDAYRATISLKATDTEYTVCPGQAVRTPIRVMNTSSHCWPAYGSSPSRFGVAVHILERNRNVVTWDNPRTYLGRAYRDRVCFIEPGAQLDCTVLWIAPEKPGHYIVCLDLVHERVTWFSDTGNIFPTLEIVVDAPRIDGTS
tara:strand:- start:5478 stop:6968 length:1491 start_codon:yes stop_codon:yes gene_type:complete